MKIKYPTFDTIDAGDEAIKEELSKITDTCYSEGSTSHTLKEIKTTLFKGLMSKYNLDKEKAKEVCEAMLNISGLSDSHFDILKRFYKTLEAQHQADQTIDANANKEEQSIKGTLKEVELSLDKLIGFDRLYRILKDLYGKAEAKRLTLEMYDYSLGLSDSSDIMIPYCWALDSTKLVINGANFGQLSTKPTHKVGSYIGALCEIVHQMSNHQAGALALGTLFLDIAHIMLYYERTPLSQVKNDKSKRKEIENHFQKLVHSVNFLSRSAVQSPFTNISVFDKDKLLSLIGEDNYGWYFPMKKEVLQDNYIYEKSFDENQYKDFIVEYIMELQKIYIDFFSAGDPSRNGAQYRFPVSTVNMSKIWDEERQCYTLDKNNELLKYIVHKDIPKYNIFCSEGTKIASCCRLISNQEFLEMASSVNSFGGGNVSLGSHRVNTVNLARIAYECDSYDEYLEIMENRIESAAKILKAHKVLLYQIEKEGYLPFVTKGWVDLSRMFSTFGILGYVEADRILHKKFNHQDFDYMKDFITKFNTLCRVYADKYGLLFNIEQIPGESFAPRLAKADNLLFGNPYNLAPIYANQFVPLWEDATVYERLERDGELNRLLTGGGIVHIQSNSDITPQQAESLILYAVEHGCEHFAINRVTTICNDCNFSVNSQLDECPNCHSKNIDYLTRVIGYFSRVSAWCPERRDWEFPRRKFIKLGKDE